MAQQSRSKTEGNVEQMADRIRELNERIIDSSKQAGEVTISAYARLLENIDVFDIELTREDLDRMAALDRHGAGALDPESFGH